MQTIKEHRWVRTIFCPTTLKCTSWKLMRSLGRLQLLPFAISAQDSNPSQHAHVWTRICTAKTYLRKHLRIENHTFHHLPSTSTLSLTTVPAFLCWLPTPAAPTPASPSLSRFLNGRPTQCHVPRELRILLVDWTYSPLTPKDALTVPTSQRRTPARGNHLGPLSLQLQCEPRNKSWPGWLCGLRDRIHDLWARQGAENSNWIVFLSKSCTKTLIPW